MRCSKFFMFPITHEQLWGTPPSKGDSRTKAIAGAFATIPEVLTIVPMEISKLGLQIDSKNRFKNSGKNVLKTMINANGYKGAYHGIFGIQLRQAIWTGIYFSTIDTFAEQIKDLISMTSVFDPDSTNATKFIQVVSGFCAGVTG